MWTGAWRKKTNPSPTENFPTNNIKIQQIENHLVWFWISRQELRHRSCLVCQYLKNQTPLFMNKPTSPDPLGALIWMLFFLFDLFQILSKSETYISPLPVKWVLFTLIISPFERFTISCLSAEFDFVHPQTFRWICIEDLSLGQAISCSFRRLRFLFLCVRC